MSQLMTTREISEYLKLHEITILKYAAKGEIPGIRIGRVWRFDRKVIDKWLKKRGNLQARRKSKGNGFS